MQIRSAGGTAILNENFGWINARRIFRLVFQRDYNCLMQSKYATFDIPVSF